MVAHLRAISFDTVKAISEWRVRVVGNYAKLYREEPQSSDETVLHNTCSTNSETANTMTVPKYGPSRPGVSPLSDRIDQVMMPSVFSIHLGSRLMMHATKHF